MNAHAAIERLRISHPDLAAAYDGRTIVADETKTAFIAANDDAVFVNDAAIGSLSEDQSVYVTAFMARMMIDGHVGNLGTKVPHIWQLAANFAVNARLTADGIPGRPDVAIQDERFSGMDAEAIYSVLLDDRSRLTGLEASQIEEIMLDVDQALQDGIVEPGADDADRPPVDAVEVKAFEVTLIARQIQVTAANAEDADRYARDDAHSFLKSWNIHGHEVTRITDAEYCVTEAGDVTIDVTLDGERREAGDDDAVWTYTASFRMTLEAENPAAAVRQAEMLLKA